MGVKLTFFSEKVAHLTTNWYLCSLLKAIHNKDYSVVKIFKAG